MSRLLNIGCGNVFHPEWVNLDAAPAAPGIIAHDLRRALPFADGSFDAIYGSHVLEHIDRASATRLLHECLRVLKPDGIARFAVPDLEAIARLYIRSLEDALAGDEEAKQRYDWAMLELFDQAVRTVPGGCMGSYLRGTLDERQAQFVSSRIGDEAATPTVAGPAKLRRALRALRRLGASAGAYLFLGAEGRTALREGLFRRSGEVHQWMYDRLSLQRILRTAGFQGVRVCTADESAIPDFSRYALETKNGLARKPDSLYAEGRRPRLT